MNIRSLIRALHGTGKVAERLGLAPNVVSNWIARDTIPAEYHVAIWKMSVEHGVPWTPPGGDGLTIVPAETAEAA